jgi:hypothetical protein
MNGNIVVVRASGIVEVRHVEGDVLTSLNYAVGGYIERVQMPNALRAENGCWIDCVCNEEGALKSNAVQNFVASILHSVSLGYFQAVYGDVAFLPLNITGDDYDLFTHREAVRFAMGCKTLLEGRVPA